MFRGPHGGTVRVLRSLLGRPDAALVAKAARQARTDVAGFWTGPDPDGAQTESAVPGTETTTTTGAGGTDAAAGTPAPARRRVPASRDRIVSLVLAAHTRTDRPLGFDQVVQLCRGRVTRSQVQTASATLCRDGQLDRIRSGVYQWSGGIRAMPDTTPALAPAVPIPRRHHEQQPADPPPPGPAAAHRTPHPTAAELFRQLFPTGVHMTAELLADYEQWARLTEKLAGYAHAS